MTKVENNITSELCKKVYGAMDNFIGTKVNNISPDNIDKYIEALKNLCPDDDKERQDIEEQMRVASRKGPKIRIKCLSGHFSGYKNKADNIKLEGCFKNHPEKILFAARPISYSGDRDVYDFQLDETLLIPKTAKDSIQIQVKKLTTKHFSKKLLIGEVDIEFRDNGVKDKYMLLDGGKPTGSYLNFALEKQDEECSSVSEIFSNYLRKKANIMFDLQEVKEDKYVEKVKTSFEVKVEMEEGSGKTRNVIPVHCILSDKIEIGKSKEVGKRSGNVKVLDLLPIGKITEIDINEKKWKAQVVAIPKEPLKDSEFELLVVRAILTCLCHNNPKNWNGKFDKMQNSILDMLATQMIIERSTISDIKSKAFLVAHSIQAFNDEIISGHLPSLVQKIDKKFFSDYKKHALNIIKDNSNDINCSKLHAAISSLKILVKAFPQWIEDIRECITTKIETDISIALYNETGEVYDVTKFDTIPKTTNLYDVCTKLLNEDAICDPKYNTVFQGLLPEYLPYCNLVKNLYVKKCKQLVSQDTIDHGNSYSSMINELYEDIIDDGINSFDIVDGQSKSMKILMRLDSETAESLSEDDPVAKLYQSNFNCYCAFKRIMTTDVEEDCSWLYQHFEKYVFQWMDLAIKKSEYQLSRLLQQEKQKAASIIMHGPLKDEDEHNDSLNISQTLIIFQGITGQFEKFLMDLSWSNSNTYLRMAFSFIECFVRLQKEFIEKYCLIHTKNQPLNFRILSAVVNLIDGLKIQDEYVIKWQKFFGQITKIPGSDVEAEKNMIIVKNCYQIMEEANKHGRDQIEHSKNMYFSHQKNYIQKYVLEGNIDSKDGNDCLLSYICDKEMKNLVDNFKDEYQQELVQRLWDLMEGKILFYNYENLPQTYDEKLHLISSIENLIEVKASFADILTSTDVTKLKTLINDLRPSQPYTYLGPPKVEKGWFCALISDQPQLHKITKIHHSGNSDQTISNGDMVYIQTLETNFRQGYDILYCSDRGYIYYDQRKPEEKKQLWIVHKTQENSGIAPLFSFESLKFPGRFLGFSHDGGSWATCKQNSGKVGWLMFVQSKEKTGVVTRLAIDPNDRNVLKNTSEELIAICLARKCKEQIAERDDKGNQIPKATLKISHGTGSNEGRITLEVKSIAGLRPMTSKGDVCQLKVCIKMFPNRNMKFDQKSWMFTGPFKNAIAFDMVGERVKHTFDVSERFNKELFFVISFFDATPFLNNIFDKEHMGINNPLGLNIFIGEFVVEREMITKHLQEGQESQTYKVKVFKDFYSSPAFKQLENRDERVSKKFSNTESVKLKREPFMTDEENWSITIMKMKARNSNANEKPPEELISMCLAKSVRSNTCKRLKRRISYQKLL